MSAHVRKLLLDTIVTVSIFAAGILGLLQSMKFPGRAGMWPTFVMASLLLFVGLHLINLVRRFRQSGSSFSPDSDSSAEGK